MSVHVSHRNFPAIATAAIAFAIALACQPARACGEGQFNMGQGLRYQGYLAPHPATVLVYDDGAGDRRALYAGLQKAGHKVTVVGSADAMSQALQAGRYDVVIADFDDAAALQTRASGTSPKPGVLPVVARSRRNAPEVSSRFKLFLLDGASLGQYLKGINQLLSMRAP
jgi:ABC-type amino acid transport substrate-binding protein